MPLEGRRIRYFIACDQARQEANNKGFLIGTYSKALIVEGTFPAVLPSLSLVACVDLRKRTESFQVEVSIPGLPPIEREHLAKATGPLDTATVILDLVPCVLPAPGTIKLNVKFADGNTETGDLEVVSRDEYKRRTWD